MRSRSQPALLVLFAALFSARAEAVCWEIGLRVQNDSGQFVSTPIKISALQCDGLVWSGSSASTAGTDGVNFRIDLNSNCPNMPQLTPGVQYLVELTAWGKAFYLAGETVPGDDIWTVRPSALTFYSGPHVHELWGYPNATQTAFCLTLEIYQMIPIGDKTTYKLRGTATGAPSYTFSWTAAYMSTAPNVNPSLAARTILNSQTATVTCTVNGTLTKSIVVGGGIAKPNGTPATWSTIKGLYRD